MINFEDMGHSAKAIAEKQKIIEANIQRERALENQQYIQTQNLQIQNERLSSIQKSIEILNKQILTNNKTSKYQFIAIITIAVLTLIATIISIFI